MNWFKKIAQECNDITEEGLSVKENVGSADVDPEELAMGIQVEYEHTNNEDLARKISLDHLSEIKDYYSRLKKMEEEAKEELGISDEEESDDDEQDQDSEE
jgi:hypothetical protein